MSQITSPATYSISRPQDVIDIVNKNSAINTSIGVIFIALGGILIDAYRAAMVGFAQIHCRSIRHFAGSCCNRQCISINRRVNWRFISEPSNKPLWAKAGIYYWHGAVHHRCCSGSYCSQYLVGAGVPRHHGLWFRHRLPFGNQCRGRASWFNVEENRNVGQPLANGTVCFDNRCLFGAFAAASVGYR